MTFAAPATFADQQAQSAQAQHDLRLFVRDDLLEAQADLPQFFRAMTGAPVLHVAACKTLSRASGARSGVFALHNVTPTLEAELIAAADKGVLQRSTLRYIAEWAFRDCGVRRLVCRVRADQSQHQDYLRRLGFRFEGHARRYFADDIDASVWVMFPGGCRWLKG